MSADLLAAFGKSGSSPRDVDTNLSGKPVPPSDALIPDLLDVVGETARVARRMSKSTEGLWRRDDDGADVLFDASTDTHDGDEFGHFEDGVQEMAEGRWTDVSHATAFKGASQSSMQPLQSLLGLEKSVDPLESLIENDPQGSEDEWGDFSTAISNEQRKQEDLAIPNKVPGQITASIMEQKGTEDSWKPVEDGAAVNSLVSTIRITSLPTGGPPETGIPSGERLQGTSSTTSAKSARESKEVITINIPPPVILLQMLPKVFTSLANEIHAQQPVQASGSIIRAYVIASRLIAGRTLRWKRDKILSQSTKIGPAVGGKGGGMKLVAIDKSENLKEEREVADVIQAWERHAHLFNSTISKAGNRRSLMTLSSKLRPRSVSGAGVLTSQHACALCGLKRDERLLEADIEVDDTFGEFWVEYWGHSECKDFWQQSLGFLPQR